MVLYYAAYMSVLAVRNGLAACIPVVLLGRKAVRWSAWDALAVVLPFVTWCLLYEVFERDVTWGPLLHSLGWRGKGLSNLCEAYLIGAALVPAAITRVFVGSRYRESYVSLTLAVVLCLFAASVFWFTPFLDE